MKHAETVTAVRDEWREPPKCDVLRVGLRRAEVIAHREADIYRRFRQRLGQTILLGLELLVAGDIVRTVAAQPSLRSVAILGGIVVIRTFLSFSLEVEISSRWPWQKRTAAPPEN